MILTENTELSFYNCCILTPTGSMVYNRKRKLHGESEDPSWNPSSAPNFLSEPGKVTFSETPFLRQLGEVRAKVSKSLRDLYHDYSVSLNLYFPKQTCQHIGNNWRFSSTASWNASWKRQKETRMDSRAGNVGVLAGF